MMRQPRFVLISGPNFRRVRNIAHTRNLKNFFRDHRWRQRNDLIGNQVFRMVNNTNLRPSNINKLKIHANSMRRLSNRLTGNNAQMYERLANAFQNAYNGGENQEYINKRYNRRMNIRIKRAHRSPSRSPPKRPRRNN